MARNKCYGCKERCIGCHSTCNDYKIYIAKLEKIKQEKKKDSVYYGYQQSCYEKADKLNRQHGYA